MKWFVLLALAVVGCKCGESSLDACMVRCGKAKSEIQSASGVQWDDDAAQAELECLKVCAPHS